MRGRSIDIGDGFPKHHDYAYNLDGEPIRNKLPWLNEHRVDLSRTVVMVESCFDLLSTLRVYDNVIGPLTVGISESKAARISAAVDVVTLFDNGSGGTKARQIIQKRLPDAALKHLFPSHDRAFIPPLINLNVLAQHID